MSIIIPITAVAQKAKMKLADNHYQSFDFVMAANIYRDVLANAKYANDSIAIRRIAECEHKTGQLISAEGYYKQLIKLGFAGNQDLRSLAGVLKMQGKYAEALELYKTIYAKYPEDDVAKRYVDNPDFANLILRDSAVYTIANSAINSASSDFAPGFFVNKKVIFSSSRGSAKKDQRIYPRTQQPYLNVYQSSIANDSTLTGVDELADKINSRYHEGTMTYDPRSNNLYITRNNFVRGNLNKSHSGKLNLGIYTSHYDVSTQQWGTIEKFPHNNKEYNVGHPTLNQSGSRIYFTSDMPGGRGGSDIYYCEKQGEIWGAPQNAGTKINTSGNEMFPYMVGDSMLYFSSNGQLGLGGLDVFYTNPFDEKPVRSVGYPANSHFDDFGLVCFPEETVGYFSSNRPNGKGDDDIYEFVLSPVEFLIVSGNVVDAETLLPLSNVTISVPTEDGSVIQVLSDNDGNYTIKAPYKKEVELEGTKQKYQPATGKGKADPRSAYLEGVDLKMVKIDYMATGKVLHDNKASAVGAIIRLYEIVSGDSIFIDSVLISNNATYSFPLQKARKYLLVATEKEYARQTHGFNTNDPNNKIHTYDFKLFKAKVGEVVRLDNIYYDYKMWDIRPDAALELNKLVDIMNDNPTMKIELGSHSDARGSDSYNLDLSDKRAKSAANYIISQGIPADRLYGKGYGETLILNHCKNDVKCSEEEHQFNRRTEFKITAF